MPPKRTEFSSEAFLNRVRQGDAEALSALVHAYTDQLFRASLGLGFDTRNAQDLAQNTWITFFEVVSRFKGHSHIRTFIFGILYNKASELRKEERRFDLTDPVEEILESRFDSAGHWIKPPLTPHDFLAATESRGLLEGCLDALPLSQKMAFTLREIEEEETAEICKVLDVTVTHLGVLLFRARNRLRECVERKSRK